MLVLGIDPGTAITGYGLVRSEGNRLHAVAYGCIRTEAKLPTPQRLQQTYEGLQQVIASYAPEEVAIEELFFNKNTKTALVVGQSRGVAILSVVNAGLPVAEYTPLQVKQSVVGYGRAEKQQVQYMVKTMLNLKEIPKPDDAADALAIAICHLHARQLQNRLDQWR